MKRLLKCIPAALLVLFGFALPTASVHAQEEEGNTFVYTNNDDAMNTVTGFKVQPNGTLITVSLFPFSTGGTGNSLAPGAQFYASHRITVTRNFLYASNDGNHTISAFKINPSTGLLTQPAPLNTPVSTGTTTSGGQGISLAATPNGAFLYAANAGSCSISAFTIAGNGGLAPIGFPLVLGPCGPPGSANEPDGIKVTPDGKFLAVALPFNPTVGSGGAVAMFKIGTTGALMSDGIFPVTKSGSGAADVDINCKSDHLFASHFTTTLNTVVSVAPINPSGSLGAFTSFPFSTGDSSNVGVLSPDNMHLFVSNQNSNQITSLDVGTGNNLTQDADSTVANPDTGIIPPQPAGTVTNRKGTLLYVANDNAKVTAFKILSDGSLSALSPNSFSTGGTGTLRSLTLFPAKPVEGEGKELGDDGREGNFHFEADRECKARGEIDFEERDSRSSHATRGAMDAVSVAGNPAQGMKGSIDAITVSGNQAIITGAGNLLDGTPLQYTAVVLGNMPVIGANHFAISWITANGLVFHTSGALTDGYIAVH
jgi:6-phosphogluconolactonase (cycloisomerase 2 family)